MPNYIEALLTSLGLTENEVTVYLSVLRGGRTSLANLTTRSRLPRTTVYSVVEALVKRGVVHEDYSSPVKTVLAISPEQLRSLVSAEEQQLARKKQTIEEAIYALQQLPTAHFTTPKVTYIAEENLESYLYSQTDIWNKSVLASDKTWWGFQSHTFVDHFSEWIDWYWTKAAPLNLTLRLLTNTSEAEAVMKKRQYPKREIKFWTGESPLSSTCWINGDRLVLISTDSHPFYLLEIKDPLLSTTMRELVSTLWNQAT